MKNIKKQPRLAPSASEKILNKNDKKKIFLNIKMKSNPKFPVGLDERQWIDRETIRRDLFYPEMESFSLRWMLGIPNIVPPPSWKVQGNISEWWTTYGNTHLSLQIGRFNLHWTRNSITMMTDFLDSKPILVIGDTAESEMIPNTFETQNAIIDVIVEWNKSRIWGFKSTSFDFLKAIYNKLHKDMRNRGAIERFMDYAKSTAMNQLTPTLIREINSKTEMYPTKDQNVWNTHEAIDQWSITSLTNMRPQLTADETLLLKGFHRAFQLQGDMGLGWNKKDASGKNICFVPSVTQTHKSRYNPDREKQKKIENLFNEMSWVRAHNNVPRAPESRILVLEHCGIRGVHQLFAIHEIEVQMQQFSWEIYDVIVGVGSGAIAAMALSCFHMSARHLLEYFYIKQNQNANQITNKEKCAYDSLEHFWDYNLNSQINALYQTPRFIAVGIDNNTLYTNDSSYTVREVIKDCMQGWPCFPGREPVSPRRSALKIARSKFPDNFVMIVCETEWIDDNSTKSIPIYKDLVSFTNIIPFHCDNDNVVYCRYQSNRKRITNEASYLENVKVNVNDAVDRLKGIQKKKLKNDLGKLPEPLEMDPDNYLDMKLKKRPLKPYKIL